MGELALVATGVVFGDTGTSPLYTYSGIFGSELHAVPEPADVKSAFSMIFWTITWTVCIKYVLVVMRVSHHGEGGILALMQVIHSAEIEAEVDADVAGTPNGGEGPDGQQRSLDAEQRAELLEVAARRPHRASGREGAAEEPGLAQACADLGNSVTILGMLGCAALIGDGVVTPAISVLSALELLPEGLMCQGWKVFLSIIILFYIFSFQRYGSSVIGELAGPIMVCWFVTMGMFGFNSLLKNPQATWEICEAFNPVYLIEFFTKGRFTGFLAFKALAGVVLCITGAEALYSDMGHFGRRPISLAWFLLVYPCLILQYMGQSAELLVDPEKVSRCAGSHHPFKGTLAHASAGRARHDIGIAGVDIRHFHTVLPGARVRLRSTLADSAHESESEGPGLYTRG